MGIKDLQVLLKQSIEQTFRMTDQELADKSNVPLSSVVNILYGNIHACAFTDVAAVSDSLHVNAIEYVGSEDETALVQGVLPLNYNEVKLIMNMRAVDGYARDCICELADQLASAQFANRYLSGAAKPMEASSEQQKPQLAVIDFPGNENE